MADVKDNFIDPFADGYDAQKAGKLFRDNPYMHAVRRNFRTEAGREEAAMDTAIARQRWDDGMLTAIEDRFQNPPRKSKNKIHKTFRGD